MSEFIKNTLAVLTSKIKDLTPPKTLNVLIGRKFQAVLLEGYLGVGYAPRFDYPTCKITQRPGELYKIPAIELAGFALSNEPTMRGIGIATINALSQFVIQSKPELYNIYFDLDVLKIIPLDKNTKVGMIGIIGPFVNHLIKNSSCLMVVDDNPVISTGLQKEGYIITRSVEDIKDSDVVIITGSTLIEHTIEDPLNTVKKATFKIVIGPTASWLPDIAFQQGIDAVSGMKFKDPEKAFRVIMEGGGTMDFSKFAKKYTITMKELLI